MHIAYKILYLGDKSTKDTLESRSNAQHTPLHNIFSAKNKNQENASLRGTVLLFSTKTRKLEHLIFFAAGLINFCRKTFFDIISEQICDSTQRTRELILIR